MSLHKEVLWRADPYSDEWYRHAVTKVTAKSIYVSFGRLDAEPRRGAVPRVVRVSKGDLHRSGFVHSATFHGSLYNDAGKAEEIACRVDPSRRYRGEWNEFRVNSWMPPVEDGFKWPSTPDEIRRRFRYLAKEHHPDLGGSASAFIALERSYRRALAMAGAT